MAVAVAEWDLAKCFLFFLETGFRVSIEDLKPIEDFGAVSMED